MASFFFIFFGNGKRHRAPPKLVCFGERVWIKIKEVIKEDLLERKKNYRRVKKEKISSKEKVNRGNKETETHENHKSRNGDFPLDGSGIRKSCGGRKKIGPW